MALQGLRILSHLASEKLEAITAEGRLRSLRPIRRDSSPVAVLDLTHNDYLGFRDDPEFQKAALASARAWPMGAGASRLLGGEHQVYADFEEAFSRWKGAASSLYFSSGYAANEALMTALALPGVAFFSDSLNHASLIDGLRLARLGSDRRIIYQHNDESDLARKLSESDAICKIVVTESLFSMDGDTAPLKALSRLCAEHNAVLVIDEAHALGVYGERGSGLLEASGLSHEGIISINPCGKAMAGAGALVSGPPWLRALLINTGRSFIYSTGASPWLVAGLHANLERIAAATDRRKHLAHLAESLRLSLGAMGHNLGASTSHILPLILGDETRSLHYEGELARRGVLARAIRPPTVPPHACRLRLSLHAGITSLDPLVFALKEIG